MIFDRVTLRTGHILTSAFENPLDFLARLAALVPKPLGTFLR